MGANEVDARFDKDTYRFHRFAIDAGSLTGTLYVPKTEPVPDAVTIRLKTNGERKS